MDMRLVGAGDRQPRRFGAGCQQQPVIGQVIATRDHDFARMHVDAEHFAIQPQFDFVVGVERVRAQRQPILGRAAGEIILGQVRSIDRRCRVIAQHDDAAAIVPAPQHFCRRKTRCTATDDDDLLPGAIRCIVGPPPCSFALFLDEYPCRPRRSTIQQSTGLKAGARKASPVRRSKQA